MSHGAAGSTGPVVGAILPPPPPPVVLHSGTASRVAASAPAQKDRHAKINVLKSKTLLISVYLPFLLSPALSTAAADNNAAAPKPRTSHLPPPLFSEPPVPGVLGFSL